MVMISHKKRDFHWFNWATLVVLRKRYPLVKKPYLFVNNDDSFSVTFKSSEIFGMWYCIKNPLLVFFSVELCIEWVYHHLWIKASFTIVTIADRFLAVSARFVIFVRFHIWTGTSHRASIKFLWSFAISVIFTFLVSFSPFLPDSTLYQGHLFEVLLNSR